MPPFISLNSHVIALDRRDVDTDAILPKQYMAMVHREGFGRYLFDNWRYMQAGSPGDEPSARRINPSFVLNRPASQGAEILLCRANFGCGSSREHAVWALADWGIRALVAPSFAQIFYNNCCKNGILPVVLDANVIEAMFAKAEAGVFSLTINLSAQLLTERDGSKHSFDINPTRKKLLLTGIDEIECTLAYYREHIVQFESEWFSNHPWLVRQ